MKDILDEIGGIKSYRQFLPLPKRSSCCSLQLNRTQQELSIHNLNGVLA